MSNEIIETNYCKITCSNNRKRHFYVVNWRRDTKFSEIRNIHLTRNYSSLENEFWTKFKRLLLINISIRFKTFRIIAINRISHAINRSHLRSTQKSSSRERSTQFVDREMQQSLIRLFHQLSIKHSSRESSIARNFLRQSSSFSSQSEVQEISEISENFYSRQFSSSEKKSTLRQSFQFRFSKFYQSSQLSKQFYRSLFVSSLSFVSSRSLSHEYSSSISSRSFVSLLSSSMNQSIKTSDTDYDRELINLIKLYSDKTKYSEENDNFSFKLIMFNDMCDRVDVLSEIKLKAFLTMLKKLTLNYYYANVINSKTSFTFDDVCISMTNYFEDAEYKRNILNKWNNLTLKSIMHKTENERKFMNECLQLLIKSLRHLQHDLESTLRIDEFIHNKLVNACQKISACQYACFKSSDTLTELINDLKSSIITYQKAHFIEFTFSIEFIFFIDRRYHRNFQFRIREQNREYQNRKYQNRRNQNRTRKVCFVCQKEECWSTKHTRNEREDAKRKFRNRFVDQMNKRIDQYIAEYEELEEHDSDENDQNTNNEIIKNSVTVGLNSDTFFQLDSTRRTKPKTQP
jgi:hypothetical protein